jgi:hypothetical protein
MRALAVPLSAILLTSACGGATAQRVQYGIHGVPTSRVWVVPDREVCAAAYGEPEDAGRLGDDGLVETSGVVASSVHGGVLWMHNDSGDGSVLYAMRTDGAPLGRLTIPDVTFQDVEDIATAPCPDLSGPCLYVADTGNNTGERVDQIIYAVLEPDVDVKRPLAEGAQATRVWRLPIAVPGAPADLEAMAVAADATAIFLFEKEESQPARIFTYAAPWTLDERATLVETGTFEPPGVGFIPKGRLVTGAALHPSGTRLLLRTYTGVFEYRLSDSTAAGDIGSLVPDVVALGPLTEPQGEAVAYDGTGTGIWTISEDPAREPGQMLHHYGCE